MSVPEHEPDPPVRAADIDGSSQRGQVAAVVAVFSIVLCIALLLGVIGALAYASQQAIRVATLNEAIEDLNADILTLQHQQTLDRQIHEAQRYQLRKPDLSSRPDFETPASDDPATPTLDPPSEPVETNPLIPRDEQMKLVLFGSGSEVDEPRPSVEGIEFPQPVKIEQRTGRLIPASGPYTAIDRYTFPYAAVSPDSFLGQNDYSPLTLDGESRHAYFVDGANCLHKINVETLVEERQLQLGTPCAEIVVCRRKLVLALHERGCLWVLDFDSLQVIAELQLPGAGFVGAAPNSRYCYAIGSEEAIAIDIAHLKVVNRVPVRHESSESGGVLPVFRNRVRSFRVSPDGQYAYLVSRFLHQFRVDDARLVYVGQSAGVWSEGGQLCISHDGKYLAMPRSPPNVVQVMRSKNISLQPHVLWRHEGVGPIAWMRDNGRIMVSIPNYLVECSPKGDIERRLRVPSRTEIFEIAALPEQDRMLVWTNRGIGIWDLRPGRLGQMLTPATD